MGSEGLGVQRLGWGRATACQLFPGTEASAEPGLMGPGLHTRADSGASPDEQS